MPFRQDELTLRHELKTQFCGAGEAEKVEGSPFANLGPDGSSGKALFKSAPLVPKPRPNRRGLDLLVDAAIYSWAVSGNQKGKRKREGGEMDVDVKGKGKANEESMLHDQDQPGVLVYPTAQVSRGSNRAGVEKDGSGGNWYKYRYRPLE